MSDRLAILTGEYPPAPGGVSDYTRQVAVGLARRGKEVHIFAPPAASSPVHDDGILVHVLPDHFGLKSLASMSRCLDDLGRPTILVQYVPHAFGWRAMNLPLCLWLTMRSVRQDIWTMFHEVAHPFRRGQPMRHQVIALVNRAMAAVLAIVSTRMFVAIPAWGEMLETLGADPAKITTLPIASNLPTQAIPSNVAAIRGTLRPGQKLIGHFGTFQPLIVKMLDEILPVLLSREDRTMLLIGRGSTEYAAAFLSRRPDCSERLKATGALCAQDAADHLAACDLLLQVYPDGITGRRGTALAGLALGVPTVSNLGDLSENWWRESNAVALADTPRPSDIVAKVEQLLADSSSPHALAIRGPEFYRQRFDMERIIDRFIGTAV